jgi:hypothetical protein
MKRVSQRWNLPVSNRRAALLLLVTASLLLTPWAASAQTVQQRLDVVSAHMKQFKALSARLSASDKNKLSSSAQHLLRTAAQWDEMQQILSRSGTTLNTPLNGKPFHPQPGQLSSRQVSDPSTDLSFSRMAGFTQSETSTAWCGHNVVVAYNDSGSFLETFPIPGIGLSFNGYSLSTDGGQTFTDQGYLNPGPSLFNFLVDLPGAHGWRLRLEVDRWRKDVRRSRPGGEQGLFQPLHRQALDGRRSFELKQALRHVH